MTGGKAIIFLAPLVLTAACATTGTYDEPYALVESGWRSVLRKELPIIVNAVDGETTVNPRYPPPLKPGKHTVDVYLNTRVGPFYKQYRTLELDAAPCTRYRIVAWYTNLTHIEWSPVIYPEPIGECVAKFGVTG
jgi:hypothetical protein